MRLSLKHLMKQKHSTRTNSTKIRLSYSMPQNLLIIGATGIIGKPITREIIQAKTLFGRIAVLTSKNTVQKKSSEIEELEESGVEILVGDITSEEDVKRAYQSRSRIDFLTGVTDT